jgi:hypothetical protein
VGKIKSSVLEEGTCNPETVGVRIAESQKQKKKKISTERGKKKDTANTQKQKNTTAPQERDVDPSSSQCCLAQWTTL